MKSIAQNKAHPPFLALRTLIICVFLYGCGRSSSSNTTMGKSATCAQTKSLAPDILQFQTKTSLASSSVSHPETHLAVGTGFIDISTRNKSGEKISRRCTMSIRPINQSITELRVWTAGHCVFDPLAEEFKHSTYTLQVFLNHGYFSVPVVFKDLETIAKMTDVYHQSLFGIPIPLPESVKEQINSALPQANTKICESQDTRFRFQLGQRAKNIACFSRNEMRGLKATVTLNSKTEALMKMVINSLLELEKPVLDKFDQHFRKVIDAYLISHTSEQRRIADLRSFSYLINKNFCDPKVLNKPFADHSDEPDNSLACLMRTKIIDALKITLSDSEFLQLKVVFDDVSTDLVTLRKKTLGCNDVSINNLQSDQILDKLTPCDMGNISDSFWKKYVDNGPEIKSEWMSASVYGLNQESYFSFFTNSMPSGASSKQSASLIPLNIRSILDFGSAQSLYSNAEKSGNAFLINYDASLNHINPTKGASGSILSVFGIIPAGLLSTVDGEGTSGGAGITPLPEISDEDEDANPKQSSTPRC